MRLETHIDRLFLPLRPSNRRDRNGTLNQRRVVIRTYSGQNGLGVGGSCSSKTRALDETTPLFIRFLEPLSYFCNAHTNLPAPVKAETQPTRRGGDDERQQVGQGCRNGCKKAEHEQAHEQGGEA